MGEIGISIITPTRKLDCVQRLMDNYYRQKYNDKELIIVINNDNMNPKMFKEYTKGDKRIRVYQLPARLHLAKCLNFAISRANFGYVARFDDDDYYGEAYLDEINEAFKTKECDIVNKGEFYTYFKENKTLVRRGRGKAERYGPEGGGATTCFKKEIFKRLAYASLDRCDSILMKACRKEGYRIYSSSPYNFMVVRSLDVSIHTYQRPYEDFLKNPTTTIVAQDIGYAEALEVINNLKKEN